MSATKSGERLYGLLPAAYRERDEAQGQPLRALLGVIEDELQRIDADVAGLYDNWFIETCEEWVVPYIGSLLGVQPIHSVKSAGVSTRAYVANTLAYRRRKGTAVVLEQLARDTTGWPARAVEFFSLLATTQHTNHVRRVPGFTADLRDAPGAELAHTAFDRFAHTADVRRIATRGGRYNIPNVGLFLWRLQSYRVGRGLPDDDEADFADARRVSSAGGDYYTFHPAGLDAPLFSTPETETTITHLAEERNVPAPLRRMKVASELAGGTEDEPPFRVFVEPAQGDPLREIERSDIHVCEIPDEIELASPTPWAIAVDPHRGRLAFPAVLSPHRVYVQYVYGGSGDLGGGPYDRTESIERVNELVDVDTTSSGRRRGFFDPTTVWQVGVDQRHAAADTSGNLVATLRAAVDRWNSLTEPRNGVITVMDSLTEHDASSSPPGPLRVQIRAGAHLLIVAAEWPDALVPGEQPPLTRRIPGRFQAERVRPHFIGDVEIVGVAPGSDPNPGSCYVNGLSIEGRVTVGDGSLGLLHLAHATLVPQSGGIAVSAGNDRLRVVLERTIAGPIDVSVPIRGIEIADSIVDAANASPGSALNAPGNEIVIESSSLFGTVDVQSIHASNAIFDEPVRAARRQIGCVRFCYVPPGSSVPRRYRCWPDLAVAESLAQARQSAAAQGLELLPAEEQAIRDAQIARIKPMYTSRRYGDAEYGQLALRCPVEIRTGAESGAELGAFSFLEQPQREANLRRALKEYLRFGLEAGVFFVT